MGCSKKVDPGNLLSKNGGRIIAGYNKQSGLVIRFHFTTINFTWF